MPSKSEIDQKAREMLAAQLGIGHRLGREVIMGIEPYFLPIIAEFILATPRKPEKRPERGRSAPDGS